MNVVAIIQARMGSTRLPGKVLMDIEGMTMLERVVRRTSRSSRIDETIVATSTNHGDDVIAKECDRIKAGCFRGNEDDVLDRYYRAAMSRDASVVVRITSDCPLIDADIVDEVVGVLGSDNSDYASNTIMRTYPRGLDVEAMTMDALTVAWREAKQAYEREHVTPHIYSNPSSYKLSAVKDTVDRSHLRWTVDTQEDLELVRAIYRHFNHRDLFGWRDVLEFVEANPEIASINAHVKQKEMRTDST